MIKQIILNYDPTTNTVNTESGLFVGTLDEPIKEYIPNVAAETTLALVKQGLTVDDIVKLKNSELI